MQTVAEGSAAAKWLKNTGLDIRRLFAIRFAVCWKQDVQFFVLSSFKY